MPVATRNLRAHDYLWRLDIWPRRAEALLTDYRRRHYLYLATLALMIASLIFGVYTSARTLQKQLDVARLKSDFVSAVSHEFQSPLAGIRQLAEMLSSGRVPSEERRLQYYTMILRESERLSSLVENVLGFARITEKGNQYGFELVETSSWLRDAVERLQQSRVVRGASVVATIPDALPPLRVDREALAGAIGNLLDNAVKYSPECKTVWLEAESQGEYVVIRVRDQGIGIAAEDQPHIFERFYRGRNELARRIHGTGLGLSLVKEVVSAHCGRLEFESEPGKGSTFVIWLRGIDRASVEDLNESHPHS